MYPTKKPFPSGGKMPFVLGLGSITLTLRQSMLNPNTTNSILKSFQKFSNQFDYHYIGKAAWSIITLVPFGVVGYLIADLFNVGNYGQARKHLVRDLLNAVFYLTKTGCQWAILPKTYPPRKAVESFFYRAKKRTTWDAMLERLVVLDREASGKKAEPTYALIDSQSVKTTLNSEERGIDGKKR